MSQDVLRKPIPGFPGYEIDTEGQVWSQWKRTSLGRPHGTTFVIGANWNPLHLILKKKSGYIHVHLKGPNGLVRNQSVHVLVLRTFVGPCPDGMECRHLDGVRSNNKLDNLKWGTPTENAADRATHGTLSRGESHGMVKLTESLVRLIRERSAKGESNTSLARNFKVARATIYRIITRKNWSHV